METGKGTQQQAPMNTQTSDMNPNADFPSILVDKPLPGHEVLADDKLGRVPFARTVTKVLQRVSGSSGLVVSIEGAWGSGKTTTLSIVEEVLRQEPEETCPVIVHFNPWLVGDRDALLRQFLGGLASEVKLGEPSKDGKRVAKELKAYAKAFDLLKLIPGAEPWASIVKTVVDSTGEAVGSFADYKAPDIEHHRQAVAEKLRQFRRRIIVFIDDIDRLFPLEVFEMVRIIKAVGDLPYVGYVVAWDPGYVREALTSANVPVAATYLDKIVQVRLPLPALSSSAKTRLINAALKSLPQEAHKEYFHDGADRISLLFYHGLRNLLEQPRDVQRVFAVVRTIEPSLRGEIALSDIIGLSALMVTAEKVFELLKMQPEVFVGTELGVQLMCQKPNSAVEAGNDVRNRAIDSSRNPSAVRELVQFLFPLVAEAEGETAWPFRFRDGHISKPERLAVALQHTTSETDVSLVDARRFLLDPDSRAEVERSLSADCLLDFMEQLRDFSGLIQSSSIHDLDTLCSAIARLADGPVGVKHTRNRSGLLTVRVDSLALDVIEKLVRSVDQAAGTRIASMVAIDRACLSVASRLLMSSYRRNDESSSELFVIAPEDEKETLVSAFAENVASATQTGALFECASPSRVLWALALLSPSSCQRVFLLAKNREPNLDGFALALLSASYDSYKGQVYGINEHLDKYVSLNALKAHAQQRLHDDRLDFPAKAAWLSVATETSRYAVDGTEKTE